MTVFGHSVVRGRLGVAMATSSVPAAFEGGHSGAAAEYNESASPFQRPAGSSRASLSAERDRTVYSGSLERSVKDRDMNGSSDPEKDVERGDGEAEQTGEPTNTKAFEVTFDDHDSTNPRQQYGTARKWTMVFTVSLTALCVTCVSSLYTQTYEQIEPEFGVSEIVATLGLSLFVAGLGIGPMLLAPLSEFYGRVPVYVGSMALFTIWIVPCAVAQNIQTMLVSRFIHGFTGSAFLSVAGGTVGDLFEKNQLDLPMMIFTASPFLGPEIGPIVGGAINAYLNW